MPEYRLVKEARADLKEIRKYTRREWGVEQWPRYFETLTQTFRNFAARPETGQLRDDLQAGVRSGLEPEKRKHVIYFRVVASGIEILRILHCSQDVASEFESLQDGE